VDLIVRTHASTLWKLIQKGFNQEIEAVNKLNVSIHEMEKEVKALPVPEKISLEPIIDLLAKRKKVSICGFEFVRTSVVIFVLTLISFFSLVLNIKQMDDYRALKRKYRQQTEYIQQMEIPEEEGSKKSK
jgi:hypothetical protein